MCACRRKLKPLNRAHSFQPLRFRLVMDGSLQIDPQGGTGLVEVGGEVLEIIAHSFFHHGVERLPVLCSHSLPSPQSLSDRTFAPDTLPHHQKMRRPGAYCVAQSGVEELTICVRGFVSLLVIVSLHLSAHLELLVGAPSAHLGPVSPNLGVGFSIGSGTPPAASFIRCLSCSYFTFKINRN